MFRGFIVVRLFLTAGVQFQYLFLWQFHRHTSDVGKRSLKQGLLLILNLVLHFKSTYVIKKLLLLLLVLLQSCFNPVQLCATPETAAHLAPLSLGFSRQEHWRGLPFPPPMHESEN